MTRHPLRRMMTVATACAAMLFAMDHTLSTKDPRPLDDLLRQAEERYGWRITFEEPPWESPGDLVEGADTAYRTAHPGASHLIPRGKPVSFTFQEPADPHSIVESRRIIDQMIKNHHTSGNPGIFQVRHNGDYSHVVPSAVAKSSGGIVKFDPMLDTRVSFSTANRTVGEAVSLILGQVSQSRGIRINQGTVPNNLFVNHRELTYAHNEMARDVLMRVFDDVNITTAKLGLYPVRVTWDLLYSANERAYYYNAHVISNSAGKPKPFFNEKGKGK